MRVLILGAGGGVGSHVAEEARGRGHDVTGAGRDAMRDADAVAAAARGHDVVINAAFDRSRPDSLLEILQALLAGLPRAGVDRLILVGGAGTLEVEPGKRVVDLDDFNPDYKSEALAHADALALLRAADTRLDWTVVTPPRSFDESGRTGSYREAADALLLDADGLSRISLEDFAAAILDEAESPRHTRARFTVAY
jgi:putative NADH-flavin reductase